MVAADDRERKREMSGRLAVWLDGLRPAVASGVELGYRNSANRATFPPRPAGSIPEVRVELCCAPSPRPPAGRKRGGR